MLFGQQNVFIAFYFHIFIIVQFFLETKNMCLFIRLSGRLSTLSTYLSCGGGFCPRCLGGGFLSGGILSVPRCKRSHDTAHHNIRSRNNNNSAYAVSRLSKLNGDVFLRYEQQQSLSNFYERQCATHRYPEPHSYAVDQMQTDISAATTPNTLRTCNRNNHLGVQFIRQYHHH